MSTKKNIAEEIPVDGYGKAVLYEHLKKAGAADLSYKRYISQFRSCLELKGKRLHEFNKRKYLLPAEVKTYLQEIWGIE